MEPQVTAVDTPEASASLAAARRTQLAGSVAPRVKKLGFWIDARLVRTLVATVEAILLFRNRAQGLLLSEIAATFSRPSTRLREPGVSPQER